MRTFLAAWVPVLIGGCFLGGCAGVGAGGTKQASPAELAAENSRLANQVAQQQRQLAQADEQLAALRGFPDDRLAHLVQVADVRFGRYAGGYDADGDGVDDGVNAYLVLRDAEGQAIKAAGQVDIELLDLAAGHGDMQVGSWHYRIDQLTDYWLPGFMADHYRFKLTWPAGTVPQHPNLTIKLVYTDGLTGRVMEIQKMLGLLLR